MQHRITYPDQAVYITSGDFASNQTTAGSIRQLSRIGTVAWSVNYGLQNQSYLDAGTETIIKTRPTVLCNLEYQTTDGYNEAFLGMTTGDSEGIFRSLNTQKNLYIVSSLDDGKELVGNASANRYIIGLGQALVNSYSMGVNVGGVMTSSVTLEALNAETYSGFSGFAPLVNVTNGQSDHSKPFIIPTASSLYNVTVDGIVRNTLVNRGSETTISFITGNQFASPIDPSSSFEVQNFRMDFSLNRSPRQSLGDAYPAERPIIFPIDVSVSTEALISTKQLQALNTMGCMTATGQDIVLTVNKDCGAIKPFQLRLMGLQLEHQEASTNIGRFETCNFTWNLTINNPFDLDNNVFLKGIAG